MSRCITPREAEKGQRHAENAEKDRGGAVCLQVTNQGPESRTHIAAFGGGGCRHPALRGGVTPMMWSGCQSEASQPHSMLDPDVLVAHRCPVTAVLLGSFSLPCNSPSTSPMQATAF